MMVIGKYLNYFDILIVCGKVIVFFNKLIYNISTTSK